MENPSLPSQARRALLRLTRAPLFHGTRYLSHVLRDDELAKGPLGSVSLTRCPDVAAYCAADGPREWDDGRGAILILDGHLIRRDFELHRLGATPWSRGNQEDVDLFQHVTPLSGYAVGYVYLDDLQRKHGLQEPLRAGAYRPAKSGTATQQRALLAAIHEVLVRKGAALSDVEELAGAIYEARPGVIARLTLDLERMRLVGECGAEGPQADFRRAWTHDRWTARESLAKRLLPSMKW